MLNLKQRNEVELTICVREMWSHYALKKRRNILVKRTAQTLSWVGAFLLSSHRLIGFLQEIIVQLEHEQRGDGPGKG